MMNCTKAIEHYKKEIMKILGMKKWGVVSLVEVDDETAVKVYNIMEKIEELKYAKYKLDRIRRECFGLAENLRSIYESKI